MATLGEMKEHIADDLDRTGWEDRIDRAIKSAIKLHEGERFWFNETRDYTFNTVNGTQEYSITEGSGIADFEKVDYLNVQIGSAWEPMGRVSPDEMEALYSQGQSGQPYLWSYYNEKFRFYPTPNAAYSVRVAGHYKLTALSGDSEENAWTNEAEELIEERAKAILYAKTIRNAEQAATHGNIADSHLSILRTKTGRRTGTGRIKPWC